MTSTTAHAIALVRQRARERGQQPLLLVPAMDLAPRILPWSRRAARLLQRIGAERPGLTLSALVAELSQNAHSGVPAVLVDKLAAALLALLDGQPPPPPRALSRDEAGFLAALRTLEGELRGQAGDSRVDEGRLLSRLTFDEEPPAFFYAEGRAQTVVPAGISLPLSSWRSAPLSFVGVRGPLLSPAHQLVAVGRILDVVLEPIADEEARLQRVLQPRQSRFFAVLDALTDEVRAEGRALEPDHVDSQARAERVAWRIAVEDGLPAATPLLQRRADRNADKTVSGYTRGQRLKPKEVQALAAASVVDKKIAKALLKGPHPKGPTWHELQAHPRLLTDDDRPLTVGTGRLGVSVLDEGKRARVVAAIFGDAAPGGAFTRAELVRALAHDGDTLAVLDEARAVLWLCTLDPPGRALANALAAEDVVVEVTQLPALLERFQELQRTMPVALPAALEGDVLPGDATPVFRLAALEGGGVRGRLVVEPVPGAPGVGPGQGSVRLRGSRGGHALTAVRDLGAERKNARALDEELAQVVELTDEDREPGGFVLHSPSRSASMLLWLSKRVAEGRARAAWAGKAVAVASAGLDALRVTVSTRGPWIDLEGAVGVDQLAVDVRAVLDALRAGERFVRVDEHHLLALRDDLVTALSPFAQLIQRGALPRGALPLLSELARGGAALEGSFSSLQATLDSAAALDGVPPAGLLATLRPYQQEGVRFLRRLRAWGTGGVLADDMGLGKTLQAMALLVDAQAAGPALVVAPTSVVGNWQKELERFAPSLRPLRYAGAKRHAALDAAGPGDVVLVTWGLLARDAARLAERRFSTLVLDEAQAIKNAATRRAQAARTLSADFRMCLTGTPIENHTGELWSIVDAASPGLLGTIDQFRARFQIPIEREGDAQRRRDLARTIRPFVLRRKKAEVAPDLPSRTEVDLVLPQSLAERHSYERLQEALAADLKDVPEPMPGESMRHVNEGARMKLLAALTRLRLCACHPRLGDPTLYGVDGVDDHAAVTLSLDEVEQSSKLRALTELCADLKAAGHAVLVFSQFVRHLRLAEAALNATGVSTLLLTGDVPAAVRTARVDAFMGGEADAFLISLKAGGTGLTLTRASYVILLDPWWNPAVEDQAADRAHRIGQTQPVTIYRLIAQGTVEEGVRALHHDKRALTDGVLEGTDAAARLALPDLVALIRGTRRHAGDTSADPVLSPRAYALDDNDDDTAEAGD